MPDIAVQRQNYTVADPTGLPQIQPLDETNARDMLEYELCKLPLSVRLAYYRADQVHLDVNTKVDEVKNLMGAGLGEYGPSSVLRDPAAASAERATVSTFGSGKSPALLVPSGTIEPMTLPKQLSVDKHAIMTSFRISSGVEAAIIGHPGASSFAGIGVSLRKMATTHYVRWYYTTTNYLEFPVACQNKQVAVLLEFDANVGRKLYVQDGSNDGTTPVASDLTSTGKSLITSRDIQRFGNGANGANAAAGLHGDLIHLDTPIADGAHTSLWAQWRAFATQMHSLGA